MPAQAGQSGRRRILLVKSEPNERRRLRDLLTNAGYDVDVAANGLEALTHADQVRPDAVLTDLVLPKLDGMALLRAFRSRPETRGVPVLIVSAVAEPSKMIEAISSGARFYLVEPVEPDSLLEKLKAVFE